MIDVTTHTISTQGHFDNAAYRIIAIATQGHFLSLVDILNQTITITRHGGGVKIEKYND